MIEEFDAVNCQLTHHPEFTCPVCQWCGEPHCSIGPLSHGFALIDGEPIMVDI